MSCNKSICAIWQPQRNGKVWPCNSIARAHQDEPPSASGLSSSAQKDHRVVLKIVDIERGDIDGSKSSPRGQLQVVLKDGSTGSGSQSGRHEVAGDGREKYAQLVPEEHGRPHWRNQKPISMHKSVRQLKKDANFSFPLGFYCFISVSKIERVLSTENQRVLLINNGGNSIYVLFWSSDPFFDCWAVLKR